MKLFKKLKKGFTLVELVVVIAVIAILAALSVVSYIGVTNKAKAGADSEIITQLNTQMRAKSIMEGPNKTAYDAYLDAREIGFNLELMKPSSSGKFVWDQENDLFACVEVEKDSLGKVIAEDKSKSFANNASKSWVYTSSINETAEYCQYLNSKDKNENVINAPATIKVKSGFDTGENMTVKSVIYDRKNETTAKEVVIRTNSIGTSLTVNAPKDVIRHYDIAGSVNIIESHTASYHEYGKVPFVEIAKGRIALEKGAEVTKLHFDATTQQDFDQIIVAADPSVTLPEFSRDEAVIKETGTLVVELQKDTKNNENTDRDYVWLYKQGVISQIVVTEEKVDGIHQNEEDNKFYGYTKDSTTEAKTDVEEVKLGVAEKTQETQKAAVEIANNYTGSHGTTQTVGGKENVNVAELDTNGDIKDEDKTAAVEEKGLDETAKQEQKQEVVSKNCTHIQFNQETERLYHNCPICGVEFGTETLPYQLHNAAEFEAFLKLNDWEGYPGYYKVNKDGGNDYLYVNLANDIDCSTVNWPEGYSNAYYLIFDGNGHKLSNIDNKEGSLFNYVYYWMDMENITFENCAMKYLVKYPYYGYYHDNGGYTDFYCYNLKFKDCTFYDAMFDYAYDCVITMEDCVLDGCVNAVGNSLISYGGYSANGLSTGFVFDNVDIKNSVAYGGAYIFYGGSGDLPITFKDCNVTNTSVYGGQGMALGGFVGNASTSTVSFDGCSFDGEIVSSGNTAAGFIGQPSNKLTIKNSYISESTQIINKGGSSVCAFAGSGSFNKDGNRFLGTLSSTATSLTKSNGFEGFNYVKYSTLATKDDFTFDMTTGELKYIGNGTFDKITVREQIGIDNIGAGLGGYSWVFDLQDTENVTKNTSLGNYTIVNSFKQVVDEDYEGQIPFMTTDKSYLDKDKKVAGNGLYFYDGILAIDSQIYNNGSQFIFGGLSDVDNIPATRTIKLEIILIVDGNVEGSVTLSYNVNIK